MTVKLNSHGLRDNEYLLTRTKNGRILVLGDSFGWGFGVEHEDIFSEVIERRNREWEIINQRVRNGSAVSLLTFEREFVPT